MTAEKRPLHEPLVYALTRVLLRLVFRVRVIGLEHYPAGGRRLVIANHTSWLDAALLAAFLPDRPVFAVDTQIARMRWVKPFLRLVTAYPIDPTQPMLLKTLCACVEEGRVVVVFPEGRLTTTGGLMKVYDGAGFIAHHTGAAIVPVHIDGAHLSVFTRLAHKYRRRFFPRITLTISPPRAIPEALPRDEWTPFVYRLLSESAFLAQNQARSVFRELMVASGRHGGKSPDLGGPRRAGANLRADPGALGLPWRTPRGGDEPRRHRGHHDADEPPGRAGLLGAAVRPPDPRLAQFHDGNLRLRLDRADGRGPDGGHVEGLRRGRPPGGPRRGPAGKGRRARLPRGPARPRGGGRSGRPGSASPLAPAITRNEARWESSGRDRRAAILFTSGSSGLPKAVVLSHSNLLANVAQLRARIDFAHSDCVFNALPLFHAFGFTGGMLTPILSGVRTVLYPTPLHYGLIPEFIYSTNATIFFATNSFLNGYARKANGYDFFALRYVFAGAEKLQPATQKLWNERFGIRIFEGYGTTEASPALTMNTPLCYKPGTVGQFIPGIELPARARARDRRAGGSSSGARTG